MNAHAHTSDISLNIFMMQIYKKYTEISPLAPLGRNDRVWLGRHDVGVAVMTSPVVHDVWVVKNGLK